MKVLQSPQTHSTRAAVDAPSLLWAPLSESHILSFQKVGSWDHVYHIPFCLLPNSQIPKTPESRWVRFHLSRIYDLVLGDKDGLLRLLFVPTTWLLLNTCFSSGSLEFWHTQRMLTWTSANKNLGGQVANGLPGYIYYCVCVARRGVQSVSPLMGQRAWKSLHKGASRGDFSCAFLHYDPDPYYITVINLSHEYNYRLSAMSLSGESLYVGGVSRTPTRIMGSIGAKYINSCALWAHTQLLPIFLELVLIFFPSTPPQSWVLHISFSSGRFPRIFQIKFPLCFREPQWFLMLVTKRTLANGRMKKKKLL